jgi:hypothetical protein
VLCWSFRVRLGLGRLPGLTYFGFLLKLVWVSLHWHLPQSTQLGFYDSEVSEGSLWCHAATPSQRVIFFTFDMSQTAIVGRTKLLAIRLLVA